MSNLKLSEWHQVLSDTRGPYTTLLYEGPEDTAHMRCMFGPSPASRVLEANVSGGWGGSPPIQPKPDGVQISSFGVSAAVGEEPASSTVTGLVGQDVSDVTMVLEGGERITATVANGWFLAWWPSGVPATAEEVTTSSGTATRQIYNPARKSGSGA